MRSEDPLVRLADLLAEAASGDRPTPRELAELLWLAGRMEPPAAAPPHPPRPAAGPGGSAEPPPPRDTPAPAPAPAPAPDPARGERQPGPPPRAPLHLPSPAPAPRTGPRYASLLAPAPPMLRHPLGLQRALRPLKRRADAPLGRELDERATADRIARLGADPDGWLPVMRPARERWLSLRLVHDTGPTMPVWQPLVRELHTAFAQSGVFRTVTLHRAAPDGTVHGHGAHAPADGRTVLLLLSDCMGPQWREGPAAGLWYATLRRWAHRMPVAVVQPLPERLWRDTALPTVPGRLAAPHPAAPCAALTFTPYDPPEGAAAPDDALPLPVLEPEPEWLANWAALLTSPGGTGRPAAVARLGGAPPRLDDRADLTRLTPEELVLRFRATASPEAFRLAGHLAVGRPDLPVMRLVQAALEPDPRPQHLAEVVLSGMLTTVPGPPGSYAFRPGVRDLLLRGLPRTARGRTTDLLERVGGLIDTRAGRAPGEFVASTPAEGGTHAAVEDEAFASVDERSVRRLAGTGVSVPRTLAGRYRPLRPLNQAGTVWLARAGTGTVVLRLHTRMNTFRRTAFLRDAELLRDVRHENVTAVHEYGVADGVPYVVMEHLDGIPLNSLAAPNGYRLPAPLFAGVAAQLSRGLEAVHQAGVTHGRLGMSRVMLLPDGTVKLSLFEPGRTAGEQGRSEDLRALSELLLQLASGTSRLVPPVDPGLLTHLPPSVRQPYAHAFDRLMYGRNLLADPELSRTARQAYHPRSYEVLGPLRLRAPHDDHALPDRMKALLAMLLLKHGRVVTRDELRAGLWNPGDEPRDAPAAIARTASRLRTLLGPGAALATLPDGYALHTGADFVDLVECERLVARAGGREPREARGLYDRALALWHPSGPLPDVPGPAAHTARTRLLRLRLTLHRTRAELDLDLDEVARAAADLAELVRAHPSREDFRRLYLIALRRQGRLAEALEVFEEYELSGGTGPELLALGRELREEFGGPPDDPGAPPGEGPFTESDGLPAGSFPTEEELPSLLAQDEEPEERRPLPRDEVPESLFTEEPAGPDRARLVFRFADGPRDADTHALLGRAVTRLVAASGVDAAQFPLEARDDGFSLPVRPGGSGRRLLRTLTLGFRDLLAELDGVRLYVGHGAGPDGSARAWRSLAAPEVHGVLVVGPGMGEAEGIMRYERPERLAPPPPVRGPYPLPPDLPPPAGITRTVVRDRRGTEYYEVDLRESRTSLLARGPQADGRPVFTARGEARWQVTDARTAAAGSASGDVAELIRRHLTDRLRRLTELYPPTRVAEAREDLYRGLARLAVPGFDIRWDVHLSAAPPRPASFLRRSRTPAARALRQADAVLLGFDGTLTRLWTKAGQAAAVRELTRVLAELRDPEDALAGKPLLPANGPVPPHSGDLHPVDLLRALQETAYEPVLRDVLTRAEREAVRSARALSHADLLVRTLADKGLTLALVTDAAEATATGYLELRGLLDDFGGGVHGRSARLMPDPETVQRALARIGVPPARCLLAGSTAVEERAAGAAGVAFLRVADETGFRDLLDAARER
ncbi:SAV_2336 N-terminal domain-related protein [Streptomyces glaucescens]|uniref:Protein kinase domain-containing protein n=1 Tax=Streptomyces glaucescens TaxID=1907 RepID=A0A089X349_STRGA|nr:SAV_2336 N-terminal domain-related protein [Streptomyces glaucescens]AIR98252.1 hypothetical protein SGLAU_11240 [Streptomyces glaucescens]